MMRRLMIAVCVVLFGCTLTAAQDSTILQQKDLVDVLNNLRKTKPASKSDQLIQKKLYYAPLPIIGYGPAYGFIVGGGLSISSLLGNAATTRISSGLMNLNFTTHQQMYLNFRTNIYRPDDEWILQGDWRFMLYAQPTYGLGISDAPIPKFIFGINGIETDEDPREQPMRFNYIRFHEDAYKKISRSLYAGIGIGIDYHFNISDQKLSIDTPALLLTSHYLYSKLNGFNTERYSTNGVTLNVLYDSRDNAINPYKGSYAQLSFHANPTWLGSSKASTSVFIDYRSYLRLIASKPENILAFWAWGQFLTSGKMPYLALPSLGWDMYSRSGRGYVQGRIRGENIFYAEAEYRFPLTANGFWGGVLFANGTTASNSYTGQHLFSALAPGYGAGIRLKMSKKTRTNIGMDLGFGRFNSGGIYFNLQEAF